MELLTGEISKIIRSHTMVDLLDFLFNSHHHKRKRRDNKVFHKAHMVTDETKSYGS